MDLHNVHFFLNDLKTNREPEDDLRQVVTCTSISQIKFSCVWTHTDLILVQLTVSLKTLSVPQTI
jgi:hypothetical protein